MNKKNIMIIDDDATVHFINKKLLASIDWIDKIYTAANGEEALRLMDLFCQGLLIAPNIVLVDLHMPVMDGFEFIQTLQQMDCVRENKMVVVVLSSSVNPMEQQRIKDMGVNYFIEKPISIEKLLWVGTVEFR